MSSHQSNQILIIGASTRSAAESAHRRGFQVHAIDLFGDRDLAQIAHVQRIDSLDEVAELANTQSFSEFDCFLMCGGMEHRPQVVRMLESRLRNLGPSADVIKKLRSHEFVKRLLHGGPIRIPEMQLSQSLTRTQNVKWLWKPKLGCGGLGISWAPPTESNSDGYWQKYIQGHSLGVVWEMSSKFVSVSALTTSYCVSPNQHPHEFIYKGSSTLIPNEFEHHCDALTKVGEQLYSELGIQGVLQADFMVDDEGDVWFLEFNPRWAASYELIEFRTGRSLLQPDMSTPTVGSSCHFTKSIYYAQCDLHIVERQSDLFLSKIRTAIGSASDWWLADIPMPGTQVPKFAPLVSLIGKGRSAFEIRSAIETAKDFVVETLVNH